MDISLSDKAYYLDNGQDYIFTKRQNVFIYVLFSLNPHWIQKLCDLQLLYWKEVNTQKMC